MKGIHLVPRVIESPSDKLEPHWGLFRAKLYLEKASDGSVDSATFLALCHEAEVALSDAKKHDARDRFLQDLIARYRQLVDLLNKRGCSEKASAFREKLRKLGGDAQEPGQNTSYTTTRPTGPNTDELNANTSKEAPAFTVPIDIFPPVACPLDFKPPELGARLNDTPQLVCCLGLLRDEYEPEDIGDPTTHRWLQNIKKEPDEQERLMTLAKDVIRAFKRDEFKDAKAVAEVVHLAPVLEIDDFRYLVNELYTGIDQSGLLDVHQLEGLARVVQGARPGYLQGDDFVQILKRLAKRLKNTHQQSTSFLHPLTIAVSHVLDAMADTGVKGLDRERIHQPLSSYLNGLKTSSDPYLVYQAAYAYQALQYIPDDETPQQQVLRRFCKTVEGVSELVKAVKEVDYKMLVSGLVSLQEGLALDEINQAVRNTCDGISSLMESGRGFRECLQGEYSFSRKRAWYPALRAADALIRAGEFTQFTKLVCEAPYRRDAAFQWGVCERLGRIGANPKWDPEIRNGAVLFLGEIYHNDELWGRQAAVKQWILRILMQLSTELCVAKILLRALERNDYNMNRQHYQKCIQNGGTGIHLLKIALPEIGSPSLLDRVQERLDVEGQIRQLRGHRLKEREKAVYIQPRAKASVQARDETSFQLLDKVNEFLASHQRVFLLLGESGAGKSTFTRELEHQLWKTYEKKSGAIPLYINLPAINKPEHDLIAKQLRKAEFTEPQIRELKLHREFILICDGYDESQQKHNLYITNRLNKPGEWIAKMVISCRSECLGTDYRDQFQPVVDRNHHSESTLFQEAVISPFSVCQIREYVTQYVSVNRPLWEADKYMKALKLIPSLKDLVTNPFLISLSLEVLPRVVNPGQDLSTTHITRASLYDQFIEHWFERGKKRLGEKKMSSVGRTVFESLVDEGFTRNGIHYFKRLSEAIYKEQKGYPIVKYTRCNDQGTWKAEFFSRDEEKQLLREACPLVRSGNQHRFIHRSLLEYGVSLAIFDPQDWKEQTVPDSVLSRRGSVGSISSYYGDEDEEEKSGTLRLEPDLNSPLVWRCFTREPSVLQFLEERANQEPSFKQQLLAYIEHSKKDKKWRTAASNAITILVRSGMQFNEEDLRGIQIPKADLRNGMFDSARLQGADLKGVDLRGVWLKNADLSNADMRGALMGDLLYLEHKDSVEQCLYSPCGRSIAVALNNKEIRVYSPSPWDELCAPSGYSGEDESIAYSPCGCRLAFGGDDNTIRIWHIESKVLEHTLRGHGNKVTSVAYSPDGYQIASASLDATVMLWNAKTGKRLKTMTGHDFLVHCVAFSPDGSQLASCSDGGTVRLWDVKTGECTHVLGGHKEPVMKVSYSPHGDRLVSFDRDTVRLWNVQSGDRRPTSTVLSWNHYMFRVFAYSPKGDQVASSLSHEIVLWSTETGTHRVLQGHNYNLDVSALAYSPQGDLIASASGDATIRLWDTETGVSLRVLDGHWCGVMSIAFSPKGDRIVSGGSDKTVRLWNVGVRTSRRTSSGHSGKVIRVDCSPRADRVASGRLDTTPRVWDVGGRTSRRSSSGHGGEVTQVKCSPKGDQVASCGTDTTVRLWDVKSGACLHVLRGHSKHVFRIAYSPEGDQIATGSLDNTVRLWDVVTGGCISTLKHEDRVNGIAYSPQGDQLASCSGDGTVRLWDVSSGECLHILIGHTEGVWGAVYSPDGSQLATSSQEGTVQLWNVKTGDREHTLSGKRQTMCRVVYSPQGDQVACYCRGRIVGLWCAITGKRLHDLTYGEDIKDRRKQARSIGCAHQDDVGQVHAVTYSPEVDQIVTGYKDGAIRVWNTKTGELLRTVPVHQTMVNRTVYSPQGHLVVSAGDDNSVCILDAVSSQCRAKIQDFQDWVNDVAWVGTPHGDYVVAGCEDGVVGMWQVIDDGKHCRVRLHWRTTNGELNMKGAVVHGAKGVRPLNRQILKQCGANGEPAPYFPGEGRKLVAMNSVVSRLLKTPRRSHMNHPSTGQSAQHLEDGSEENHGLLVNGFMELLQFFAQAKDEGFYERQDRFLFVLPFVVWVISMYLCKDTIQPFLALIR